MTEPNALRLDPQDPVARLVGLAGNGASAESILQEAATIIEEQTRTLRARLAFCYRVPWALNGISEPEALLYTAARTAVAGFADACSVRLVGGSASVGFLPGPCVVAVDRRLSEEKLITRTLQESRLDPFAPRGPAFTARTGHPDLISEVTDEHLQSLAADSDHYELLRRTSPKSYMCVPLRAGDHTGAMSFTSFRTHVRYDHDDLAAVTWLASLCECSLLYRQPDGVVMGGGNTTSPNGNASPAPELPQTNLTPRELEILQLMNRGNGRQAVAKQLGVSTDTYDKHTRSIRAKLQVETNLEALRTARAARVVSD